MKNQNKTAKKSKSIISLFILFFLLQGCSAKSPASNQRAFGVDTNYYIGLRKLEDGNEKEARVYFEKCARKGSYYCARKSAGLLTELGTNEQKKQACDFLIKNFQDEDAKIAVSKEYLYLNELSKILTITNNIDFSKDNNELIKLRLNALQKSENKNFENEIKMWFYNKAISDIHYQFYRDIFVPLFEKKDVEQNPKTSVDTTNESKENEGLSPLAFNINFRIMIYRRDYRQAWENLPELLTYFKDHKQEITSQFASDIGKTYLYATTNYAESGNELLNLAEDFESTPAEFYFLFYAGRLFDKAELYRTKSSQCFERAINATEDSSLIDNALWYLLTSKLRYSVDSIVDSMDYYSEIWTDYEYFDDFFDSLLTTLLICGKWNSLHTVYTKIDGKASDESVAKFAYIYGRLLQEGYAKIPENEDKNAKIRDAFYRSSECGTATYYKLLSAYRLGYDYDKVLEILQQNPVSVGKAENSIQIDKDAEKYLKGFAIFGLPEKIYPEWLELYKTKISLETSMYLADFLKRCSAAGNDKYLTDSLRIASKAANNSTEKLSVDYLKLIYPQNYNDYIYKYSEEYKIDPSVIFALIRSESFFSSQVVSSAGAIGLTQLMEFTASDIARRLNVSDYDLTDAQTNIQFGTYYLSELTQRCDNSLIMAFFSYNAGISRVRRWQQTSLQEFGKKLNMPADLFLETIPFTETREYGRKLVSASLVYSLLYDSEKYGSYSKAVEKLVY